MRTRTKMWLALTGILGIGLFFAARHYLALWEYSPAEPPKRVLQFVDLVEAGDLQAAYKLTNEGSLVGTTFPAFEANVMREFDITGFPVHRRVRLISQNRDRQSYGNRLRRWLRGQKVDPDQIGYEVYFDGGQPSSISVFLKLDRNGHWRIRFFETHAG